MSRPLTEEERLRLIQRAAAQRGSGQKTSLPASGPVPDALRRAVLAQRPLPPELLARIQARYPQVDALQRNAGMSRLG